MKETWKVGRAEDRPTEKMKDGTSRTGSESRARRRTVADDGAPTRQKVIDTDKPSTSAACGVWTLSDGDRPRRPRWKYRQWMEDPSHRRTIKIGARALGRGLEDGGWRTSSNREYWPPNSHQDGATPRRRSFDPRKHRDDDLPPEPRGARTSARTSGPSSCQQENRQDPLVDIRTEDMKSTGSSPTLPHDGGRQHQALLHHGGERARKLVVVDTKEASWRRSPTPHPAGTRAAARTRSPSSVRWRPRTSARLGRADRTDRKASPTTPGRSWTLPALGGG